MGGQVDVQQLANATLQTLIAAPNLYVEKDPNLRDFVSAIVQLSQEQPDAIAEYIDGDGAEAFAQCVSIFEANADEIISAAQSASEQVPMNKLGGKIEYLVKKFRNGGAVNKFYGGDKSKKGKKGLGQFE